MIQNGINLFIEWRPIEKEEITTEDLQSILVGTKIRLDCGHYSTIGHSFANTIIIVSVG